MLQSRTKSPIYFMYSSITYAVRAKITQSAILPQKIPPTPIIYDLVLTGVMFIQIMPTIVVISKDS
jgi:hypothetical protein